MRVLMRFRWSATLCGVLLGTLLLGSGHLAAQASRTGSTMGAEEIGLILTRPTLWTMYWSRLGAAPRPPASAASGSIQFIRSGDKIMGHVRIPVFGEECEFEVVIRDDGFTYPGCTHVDKDITYDSADQEFPFKGAKGSIFIWFRPQ
jgi:hypothetical protein